MSAWVTVEGYEVTSVLSTLVQKDVQENVGPDVLPNVTFDPGQANRRDELVKMAVHEFRAAIRAGGRIPLSQAADSVPEECKRHVLNLAAWQLAISTPGLRMAIMTESTVFAPLNAASKEARDFLQALYKGLPVSYPDDPELDENGDPRPNSGASGDISGNAQFSMVSQL